MENTEGGIILQFIMLSMYFYGSLYCPTPWQKSPFTPNILSEFTRISYNFDGTYLVWPYISYVGKFIWMVLPPFVEIRDKI